MNQQAIRFLMIEDVLHSLVDRLAIRSLVGNMPRREERHHGERRRRGRFASVRIDVPTSRRLLLRGEEAKRFDDRFIDITLGRAGRRGVDRTEKQ